MLEKHNLWNYMSLQLKVNGKFVKDGVYFLHVNAKGSDGRDFNIKKAINVLTGYNNGENEGGGSEE